jgi:hypothetical protein
MIKVNDFTFSAFMRIGDILNTDQYEFVDNGRRLVKGEKLAKVDRTDEFIFELHRKIVSELSGLSIDFTQDDTFIDMAMAEITPKYNALNELLNQSVNVEQIENDTFVFQGKTLSFEHFEKWRFNKWVTFENALKGAYEEIGGETVQTERGEKFVLPVCFGEWFDSMPDFQAKFAYFNDELKAVDVIPVLCRINALVNELKEGHSFIYSESENDNEKDGKNKAFSHHSSMFGWLETLRELSEKQVFGNYLETKKAPMLEVLEFLNCSISKALALNKDFETNSKH